MRSYKQHGPYTVKIELVEGCNLRCSFCGINQLHGPRKKFRYMDLNYLTPLAQSLAGAIERNGWNPRIELTMRGEPTLHPHLVECIRQLRMRMPKQPIMMCSNGAGLGGNPQQWLNRISKLEMAGLNTLCLEDYDHNPIVRKALRTSTLKQSMWLQSVLYHHPVDGDNANPYKRHRGFKVIILEDIDKPDATGVKLRKVHNQSGAAGPLDLCYQHRRCVKPFRELVVRWDGLIPLCCNDWFGHLITGNSWEHTLYDIWQGDAFWSARVHLYNGQRDFRPCYGCTDPGGTRVGLLPDPMGKDKIQKPSPKTKLMIQHYTQDGPVNNPVSPLKFKEG